MDSRCYQVSAVLPPTGDPGGDVFGPGPWKCNWVCTPAGGAVVSSICPMGIDRREEGEVGFTTSLGFAKKLERIIADPHVTLAYHAREHGFSASPAFVLAQGTASVDIRPSRGRLEAMVPQGERYVGAIMRGPVWDRLLREYYQERVFIDISVARMVAWPDLSAAGAMQVSGAVWPGPPGPQAPPKNGTGPRVDVDRAAVRIAVLPHRNPASRHPAPRAATARPGTHLTRSGRVRGNQADGLRRARRQPRAPGMSSAAQGLAGCLCTDAW